MNWVQLKIYSEWTEQWKMLGIVSNGRYLDGIMFLKRWMDYIDSFWRTKEEIAEKCPKEPKIVKNRSLSHISQRIAKRKSTALLAIKSLTFGGMKVKIRTSVTSYKWPTHKSSFSYNHRFWKMSTCKMASVPPSRLEEINSTQNSWQPSPNKSFKDFSEFCLYLEKVDFEGGPK